MKDLDIILPVYNEKEVIESVLKEWTKVLITMDLDYSFIICEDGSTDGTKELLHKIKDIYPIVLSQKPYRRGYGKSVIDGINVSEGKFILCIDSDGQCDPKDFVRFWQQRSDKSILIGWRKDRADERSRKVYSRLFKQFFSLLFPHGPHDPSAPYVLFTKKVIFSYLTELTFLKEGFWWGFVGACMKHGVSIKELPIHHRQRKFGKTRVYSMSKIPSIAFRNSVGLLTLRFSTKL